LLSGWYQLISLLLAGQLIY